MTHIQTIVESFYGSSKTTSIFQHIQVDALFALIKTNKYFHKFKKLFYILIIGKLKSFQHKYIPNYNKNFYGCCSYKALMREDMIQEVYDRIQMNSYLKKNHCLLRTYKKILNFKKG
jgi:hypothetical protein